CWNCASWRRMPKSRAATGSSPRASTAPIRRACPSPPWDASSATRPMRSRASNAARPRAWRAAPTYSCSAAAPRAPRTPKRPAPRATSALAGSASRAARIPMQLGNLPSAQAILLPVRAGTILGSLAAALLLNFLPWRNVLLVPDFVALVLAFWCVRQPRLVGLGAGWILGLLIDVGNGVLLGQHALAYSLLAFAAITLSRRMLWFPLWGQ